MRSNSSKGIFYEVIGHLPNSIKFPPNYINTHLFIYMDIYQYIYIIYGYIDTLTSAHLTHVLLLLKREKEWHQKEESCGF